MSTHGGACLTAEIVYVQGHTMVVRDKFHSYLFTGERFLEVDMQLRFKECSAC